MDRMWICGIFLLVLFVSSMARACSREELQMVQMISTHGSVSPSFTYRNDPNPPSVWTEGLKDLTMLGKFQAYALGVFFRTFYEDFITSDPRELEVISSADKATAKSIQSLVTALYAPTPYWEVVQNFTWQPIYIKYDSDENKFLSNRICPAADVEHKNILYSQTDDLLRSHQSLLYYWSIHSGMELKCIVDIEELFDVLQTEAAYNLTLPDWSKNYWDEMKYLHDVSVSLRTKSKKLRRLGGGPIVERTIETMKEKIMNELDPRKFVIYSTHPFPLLGFLSAMDFGELEKPPPCATVLVELYKHEGESFVRFLYLNSTVPQREPQRMYCLTVPGCTEFCPLKYIMEYTRDVIPRKWEEECLIM